MDFENEKWVDIPNCNGVYQVSDKGRVRSVAKQKILKLSNSNWKGYKVVSLKLNGKFKSFGVCRLVALCFLGISKNQCVRHKDSDLSNNCLENLEIIDKTSYRALKNNFEY